MKNILMKQIFIIPILYVISKFIWDLIPLGQFPDNIKDIINDIFGPIFFITIFIGAFIYIFWKTPVICKVSQFLFGTKPNIQGTWCGKLNYERNGKKREKTVFLVIKQSDGYSVYIWLLTDERKSSSIFAEIFSYKNTQRIVYTYANEESSINKEKNPSHEGLCQLDIVDASNLIQGIYYTNRKTSGELFFDRRNKKIISNYDKAMKQFGIS